METEMLSNRSKPKRSRNDKLGPAWVLGPEDRSSIETEIPNHVETESIEPRPTLTVTCCLRSFLTACRKEIVLVLPLVAISLITYWPLPFSGCSFS